MNEMGKWLMSSIDVKVEEAFKNNGFSMLGDKVNKLEFNFKRMDQVLPDVNDSIERAEVPQ